MLPADFVTCWQLSSARSFGNVFFPVWFGRLYWLGPMGILLVPACQLFPFLCKVFGSTLFHTRSLDCTAYFCCQFSVFMGYDLLLSLVAVWVLLCIRRPAGPAVLAVLPLPLLRVSHVLPHLHFRSLVLRLWAVSRPSPPVGGFPGSWLTCAVLSGFFQRIPFMLLRLGSVSAPFPEVCYPFRLLLDVRPSGLDRFPLCCCMFCRESSTACFHGQFLDPLGGVPSFSSFWVPLPMFALCVLDWVPGSLFLSAELCSLQCFDIIFGSCCPFGLAGFLSLRCILSLKWSRCSALWAGLCARTSSLLVV